ncbi:zinc ribbon domain-containing protein, partial [Streptomyces sp. ME02-6977A]|nr:zinc ribbon domain-containing protein [Streptomyces sp. ME02-6977A]
MTTQNCAECGTPAEPGQSFCDACGAVLSWDQAGAARTARPAAATSDQRPGFDAFAGAGVPPARTGRPATAPADEPAGAIGENPTLPQQRRTAG